MQLPEEIEKHIGPLVSSLHALGYEVGQAEYSSEYFGNFVVELIGPRRQFHIVRDRGQYLVHSGLDNFRGEPLGEAFDDLRKLSRVLLRWLER